MYQIVHHGPLPAQRVCCARMVHLLLFHLIKPLTSDFLTSSHRDRNTFKQLMSGHCIVLSFVFQPSPSVETTVYLSCGHRLVCRLSRVWQRNLQGSRRQGSKENTQEDRPLSGPSCSIVSSPPVTNGLIGAAVACARLLTAGSMSSDTTTSVSTPPVCAAVDVEMRFGAAGSGGAGCPSWALASTGPSSPEHKRSNRARHRPECC